MVMVCKFEGMDDSINKDHSRDKKFQISDKSFDETIFFYANHLGQ